MIITIIEGIVYIKKPLFFNLYVLKAPINFSTKMGAIIPAPIIRMIFDEDRSKRKHNIQKHEPIILKTHKTFNPSGVLFLVLMFFFFNSSIFSGEIVTVNDPDEFEDGVSRWLGLEDAGDVVLFVKIDVLCRAL